MTTPPLVSKVPIQLPNWLLPLVVLLGVALRLVAIFRREPFVDELHALFVAQGGLGPFWVGLWETPGIGPLDYGLVWALSSIGLGLEGIRLFCCALQLLGIWKLHHLTKREFGPLVGFWACALCLLSPLLIDHAASIRPYAGAFMVGVFAFGWILKTPSSLPQALGRGMLAALATATQFFLGPLVLSALGLGLLKNWRTLEKSQKSFALLQMIPPLISFALILPMILGAGDMKTGQDHPFVVFLSLLQSIFAFSGWGFLPLGILVFGLSLKGARLLPGGVLPWALLMAGLILFGEQRSQVHVLARHFTPLYPLLAISVALVVATSWNGKTIKQGVLLFLLVICPLNLEVWHPRIWLMGLDLRSDFAASLKELANEKGEKPLVLVPMGFMESLWTYVLKEEIKVFGLEKKLVVKSPGEWLADKSTPSIHTRVLVFRVPPYLDPSKAPLAALGFPPPKIPSEDFGGYGRAFRLTQLKTDLDYPFKPKKANLLLTALQKTKRNSQRMADAAGKQNKVLGDMMTIGHLSAEASIACRAGLPDWGELHQRLAAYENTLRDLQKDFQRVTGVAFAQALDRCMARAGAPAQDRVRVLKLGASYLGVPSGALVVQTQWSASWYYQHLAKLADKAGDSATAIQARKNAQALRHLPQIPPWP